MANMWRHRYWNTRTIGVIATVVILITAGAAFAGRQRAVAPGIGPSAAHVNGVPIYKVDVDAKATTIARKLSPAPSIEDVRSSVVQNMVKQEILYQTAPKYDIRISDDEVTAALSETVRNILSPEMDEASKQESLGYIQSMGLTLTQYPTDPRVINAWRRTYVIDKMRQWVIDRVPLEKRTSAQALEAAVDEFVEQQHAVVTYP